MNKILTDEKNKDFYKKNICMLFLAKSTRKNAQFESINIIHLITKNDLVSDENITNYFISTLEKCLYIIKKYNKNIVCSSYTTIYKKTQYKNANQDIYITSEKIQIPQDQKVFYSFESFINHLYYIFSLVYPYNTLNLQELYKNNSIKYFINDFYNN